MNTRKMLAGLLALGVLVAGAGGAWAAKGRPTPAGPDGERINHPLYGGSEYARAVTGAKNVAVCDGKCLLVAITLNTGSKLVSLLVLDTNSNGLSAGTQVFRFPFFEINTDAMQNNRVPFPVLMTNGIRVELQGTLSEESATVQYLDLD